MICLYSQQGATTSGCMDENIKKLAAELDAANKAWRESLKGPLAPGRAVYRKAVEAYRAFWDAVDAAAPQSPRMKSLHLAIYILLAYSPELRADKTLPEWTRSVEAGKLVSALAEVESGGRANAIGDQGRAFGILQIHRSVVDDVNRRYETAFAHRDAFSTPKAIRIFFLYQELYAPKDAGLEDRALIWHLGPTGFRRRAESPYREKAEAYLLKLRPLLYPEGK